MVRVNAFFVLRKDADVAQLRAIGAEFVKASLKDEGNIAYDLFESTTRPGVYMFCETWKDQASLDHHMAQQHFKDSCAKIAALSDGDMKVEVFEK